VNCGNLGSAGRLQASERGCREVGGSRSVSHFIYCPGCGVPAEVTGQFALASTDGPVVHLTLHCAGGHRFVTAADLLPDSARRLLAAQVIESHLSSGR
jgi:hypothetical protein